MTRRHALRTAAALAASALVPRALFAQAAFPSKPLHIVVPFSPGGVVDVVARAVGQKLSERYGQPVVIDNRAGAGGSLGTDLVAKAPADGYTLLMVGKESARWESMLQKAGIVAK